MAFYPPSQPYQWTYRRIVWATLVLVFTALSFWLLYRFYQVVSILFIAIMIGTVIRPVVTWLHRRGLPRIAGVMLVYLLLLALLIGFVLSLFPLIVEQGTTIAAAVPGYYQSLRAWMANYPNQWIVRLSEFLPATLGLELPTAQQTGSNNEEDGPLSLDWRLPIGNPDTRNSLNFAIRKTLCEQSWADRSGSSRNYSSILGTS